MFPHHPRRPMNESRAHRERACTSTCLLALLLEGVGGLSSSVCVESVHVLIHVCWPYCLRELEAVCIRTGQLTLSSTLRDCLCASEAVTRGCIVARCVCARLVVCETNGRGDFPFWVRPAYRLGTHADQAQYSPLLYSISIPHVVAHVRGLQKFTRN
jgi:hypothetical protein